ncbi:GtrA family protein [Mucilaginibacter sp.]|uniref:GtrA family protein n=1 Tax=Mucilaginibacter sp. TaxID=1882438 RepID=UPI003D0F0DBC
MKKIHESTRRAILQLIDLFYPLFRRWFSLQTFRYAACGGINTVLDIGLFSVSYNLILKKRMLNLGVFTLSPHIAAMLMALCVSLPTGFYLNRYVVFQQSGLKGHSQLMRYILVVAICIVLNFIFLKLFVDYLGWYPTPSKIATTAVVVIFSYVSQTFYFFKAKKV